MTVRVRLMNEYTIDWPLWISEGPAREGDLPVSEPLARELRAWARIFNEHDDWARGWDDQVVAAGHSEEGVRLQAALMAGLGNEYEVTLDLWEAPAS